MEDLCRLLDTDVFDESEVAESIDLILIQENGTLEIEYKEQRFFQSING